MRLAKFSICILSALVLSACGSSSPSSEGSSDVVVAETTGATTSGSGGGTGTGGTSTSGTGTDGTTTGGADTGGASTSGTGTSGTGTGGTGGETGGQTVGDTSGTSTSGTDTGTTGGTAEVFPPVYETPPGIAQCSVDDIKSRVDFDMRDYYIYYDQVPTLNLADYDSGNALIRDLRVSPDRFSSVSDQATNDDLFNEGRQGGFGFGFFPASDGVVRITRVLVGSPAFAEGMQRGDEVISVNGISIDEITNEEIREALTPEQAPVIMSIRTGSEAARTVSVDFEDYRWITAGPWLQYSSSDASVPTVGYMQLEAFLSTTTEEIFENLNGLINAGDIDELVLDLRYNGGGLVDVSRTLASVIGGDAVQGEIFTSLLWNDKYAAENQSFNFVNIRNPLNLPRLIVLSTEGTASASELLMNSLEPFIDVVVIGQKSAGKPFASNLLPYCEKSISAMRSVLANANGIDVGLGIEPDCLAEDDWLVPRYSLEDPLMNTALTYVLTGTCGDQPLAGGPGGLRKANPDAIGFELQEYLPTIAIE